MDSRTPLDEAAVILSRAQPIGARAVVRDGHRQYIEGAKDAGKAQIVRLLAARFAEDFQPVRERFIVDSRLPDHAGPGVEFLAEVVVFTLDEFQALCRAVRLAQIEFREKGAANGQG